jgi:hypothetical protein
LNRAQKFVSFPTPAHAFRYWNLRHSLAHDSGQYVRTDRASCCFADAQSIAPLCWDGLQILWAQPLLFGKPYSCRRPFTIRGPRCGDRRPQYFFMAVSGSIGYILNDDG